MRSLGELVAKPASLVFFVVIARALGEERYGEFIFGLSLSMILLELAALGLPALMAREVAREHERVRELFWDVLTLQTAMLAALTAVTGGIAILGDYDSRAVAAIVVVAAGIAFEQQFRTYSAVFQAYERQQHIATALIVNRLSTMVLGIAVVVAGGGLIPVSIVFAFGSAIGVLASHLLMLRYVVRPPLRIDRARWLALSLKGLPFGLLDVLSNVAMRSSVVLLGLLAIETAEVGEYGAAFRLIEALMFISWALSSAVMPWFSRDATPGSPPASRAFEISLKVAISITLPLGLGLSLFAEPVIETLYGEQFGGAVEPLRVLGALLVLVGMHGVVVAALVGRKRPMLYTVPALVSIAVGVALALILVPDHGALGAALATVPSVALLVVLALRVTTRVVGRFSFVRVLAPPALAGGAMAATALALDALPWVAAAVASAAVYAITLLAVERAANPDDFSYYRTAALSLRRRLGRRRAAAG